MSLSWLVVFHVLSIHPYLGEDGVDPDFFPKERFRATLGGVLYAIAGVAGWPSSPKIALLIFLALPVFYGLTSEGLTETRIRLQFGKAHHGTWRKAVTRDCALNSAIQNRDGSFTSWSRRQSISSWQSHAPDRRKRFARPPATLPTS